MHPHVDSRIYYSQYSILSAGRMSRTEIIQWTSFRYRPVLWQLQKPVILFPKTQCKVTSCDLSFNRAVYWQYRSDTKIVFIHRHFCHFANSSLWARKISGIFSRHFHIFGILLNPMMQIMTWSTLKISCATIFYHPVASECQIPVCSLQMWSSDRKSWMLSRVHNLPKLS